MKDYQKPYAKNLGELIPALGRCWSGQSASSGSGGQCKDGNSATTGVGDCKVGNFASGLACQLGNSASNDCKSGNAAN